MACNIKTQSIGEGATVYYKKDGKNIFLFDSTKNLIDAMRTVKNQYSEYMQDSYVLLDGIEIKLFEED
ncbi:hypothetical protein AB0Y04_00995 [Loigolactobacillus coryniformis]|uniref:hypothetical protein n=1 Tax=Loigolactobacillus coryniformis TaxID=1610 RepID=UPI003F2760FC